MLFQIPKRVRGCVRQFPRGRSIEILEDRTLLADGINPSPGPAIVAFPGVAIANAVLATYTIADSSGNPGTKWNARVDWGDNSAADKRLTPTALPDGSYEFLDSHTYTAAGTYTVTVNIAVPGSHKPNDNTVTTTATIKALSSIAVAPANPGVPKGLTQQFTATGTFSDNSTLDLTNQVTWASATTSVATISNASGSNGLATAVGQGTSTISATLNGVSGSTVMTVAAPVVQSIAVTPANPSVAKGLTQQFTATGTLSDKSTQDLTNQVTWASATTSVATITAAGLATALAQGTSSISATLNGVTGSTVLTVSAPVLQSIAVTPANPSVPKGRTQPFIATGTLSDNSTEDLTGQVTWASSKTTVATITAAGLATAIAQGTSTIGATLNGLTGSTVLTVTAPVLQSIAVTPANPGVPKGENEPFTATGTLSDGSTQDLTGQVTWASARTTVATITAAGLATAVAQGTSTISASLNGLTGSTLLTVSPPVLVSISVGPDKPTLIKGATQQFTATGTLSDNSTEDLTSQVTWASGTTSVATIDATGLATGITPGTSTVLATLDSITGSTSLLVISAPLSSIAITPANPSLPKGLTQQFTATGTFADGSHQDLTNQVTWASATESVATISNTPGSQGLATAVAQGTTSISATLNGISDSTTLTVTDPVLQSIAVTPANPSVPKGLTRRFTATGTLSDQSTEDLTNQVTWASARTSVATITATGLATALTQGSSSVSATFNGITGSTVLTVTAPVLESITVTPADPSIAKGLTQTFTARGTLSDNSTEDLTGQVTWTSSQTTVATITAAGLATAVAQGTSTIGATLNGLTGSTVLTVSAPVLQSIAVTPSNPSVPKGETKSFTATGTLSDGSSEDLTGQVTWASTTTSVATITTAGLATAKAHGTSTISATLGGISGSTVLTVSPAVLVSLSISPGDSSIVGGSAQPFTVIGTFSDKSTRDLTGQVTWSSAATSVATITVAGLATGVSPGSSAISAALGGIRASTILTVTPAPVAVDHVQYTQNKKHQVNQITISFGGALNPAEASNPASYRLVMPDKHGSFTSKKAKVIRLKSAAYNAALGQVTLTPRKSVALKKPVELVIPGGLHDSSGRLIDGGKTAVFVLGRQGVSVGSVAVGRPSVNPRIFLEPAIVDILLARMGGHQ